MNFNVIEGLSEQDIIQLYENGIIENDMLGFCWCAGTKNGSNYYYGPWFGYNETYGGCRLIQDNNLYTRDACTNWCINHEGLPNTSYLRVHFYTTCFCTYTGDFGEFMYTCR